MDNLILISLTVIITIPIGIFIKFLDLGLDLKSSLVNTLVFPIKAIRFNFSLYKQNKDVVLELPNLIIDIAELHLNNQARKIAIHEIINELKIRKEK